jgi:hypothetical protein
MRALQFPEGCPLHLLSLTKWRDMTPCLPAGRSRPFLPRGESGGKLNWYPRSLWRRGSLHFSRRVRGLIHAEGSTTAKSAEQTYVRRSN